MKGEFRDLLVNNCLLYLHFCPKGSCSEGEIHSLTSIFMCEYKVFSEWLRDPQAGRGWGGEP